MLKKCIFTLYFGMFAGLVNASNSDGIYIVLDQGVDSCVKFIEAAEEAKQGSKIHSNYYTVYVSGYMTGANYYLDDTEDIMGSTDRVGGDGIY